jgi:hypothetical protein
MRKIAKLTTVSIVSIAFAGVLAQAPATADSWTFRDRSGGRGPLAIESVKAGHWPSGMPYITVTFDRPLKASRMGPKDFVVVDYEGNGEPTSEGWIYVVARRGRLTSFEHNPSTGETYGSIGFDRPNPRSLRVVPWNYNQGGIAVAAASYSKNRAAGCSRGCWDFAPNRGYLVHDWTAPVFESFVAPDPDDDFWHEPEIPITWRATDTGFSGLRRTSVLWREPRGEEWRKLVTRSVGGFQEARVRAVEGAHMLIQGVAEDGAGNASASYSALLRIPWDDANASGPGMFTGVWTPEDDPEAMHESVSIGTGPAATLAFTGVGNQYCVAMSWLGAQPVVARLQVGDQAQDLRRDADDRAARTTPCVTAPDVGEHTATLTILAGRAGVDGYWAGEQGSFEAPPGERQGRDAIGHVAGPHPSLDSLLDAASLRPSD